MSLSILLNCDGGDFDLNTDYITEFKQEANLFIGDTFYIGSTVCRSFTMRVDKTAIPEIPYGMEIYDDNNAFAYVDVDNVDDSDTKSYIFTLTDSMMRLNKQNSSWFESGLTILELLANINSVFDIGVPEQLPAYGDMVITWYDNWTAREFVSWVAELLGGYAYIDNNGILTFANYSNIPTYTVNVVDCDSFKLGEQITIDRVVYDTPDKTVIYPENYSGSGCTLYLNTENQLFTDSGNITIESQVQYIYNVINGFSFYDIEVRKCPINENVKAGDCISFVLGEETYNTIAQVDWTYNTMWLGGYSLDIASPVQQETQIQNPVVKMGNTITQRIDRENGLINSTIASIREDVNGNTSAISEVSSSITQTAENLTLEFNNSISEVSGDVDDLREQVDTNTDNIDTLKTSVIIDSAGVTVKKSDSTVRGVFGATELDFIDSASGADVTQAWIGADGLGGREINVGDPNTKSQQWRIITSADGTHLRFTRHS